MSRRGRPEGEVGGAQHEGAPVSRRESTPLSLEPASAPAGAPGALLQLVDVCLTTRPRRGGAAGIDLLRDVSLAVGRGEVLGLVGESGAGKSMIGRLIAGQVPDGFDITRGRIVFDGKELLALGAGARRALLGRRIAFIPQEPLTALNPVLSIGQSFAEHLARLGVPSSRRAAEAMRHLDAVRLPKPAEMLRRHPHELSGGQCQRVLIAMAFAAEPALIVADEPTTALDVVSQAHVLSLLAKQQRRHGSAVLLITHDLRLAAHVCSRLAVMYAGEVVETGPAAAVLQHPRHPYTLALRDATPSLDGPRRRLPALSGQMPGVAALAGLTGCRFAARCSRRDPTCADASGGLREVAAGHWVLCGPACEVADEAVATGTAEAPPPQGDRAAAPLLELEDVGLRYTARRGLFGKALHTDAVVGFNLRLQPGEFVGIVGESGSGKTSIGRIVVGAAAPTAGRVRIAGDARGAGMLRLGREDVQLIFQDPHSALNPRRSVLRLLTQAYEVPGRTQATPREARARELLADTGLPSDCLQRFPSQLSGGQKQRVNIGRALCVMPRLLVADEIVSGLDVSVQAQIMNLLLELGRRHGIALLLISHDLAVVRHLCSRVIVMQAGRVVEEGPTEAVYAAPQHAYTKLLVASVPPADTRIAWPPMAASTAPADATPVLAGGVT